jgi:hypothetical protein
MANVKVKPAKGPDWNADYNRISTRQTENAKSGKTAKDTAAKIEAENKKARAAGRTRIGNLAGGARGGMGGGMNWQTK